ncbi:MAG: hypothetical protein PHW20_00215 [Clostridia bacterium]|nr:hypothetical protein [Clostridia bacterium]
MLKNWGLPYKKNGKNTPNIELIIPNPSERLQIYKMLLEMYVEELKYPSERRLFGICSLVPLALYKMDILPGNFWFMWRAAHNRAVMVDDLVQLTLPEFQWYRPVNQESTEYLFWWPEEDDLSRINALQNCIEITKGKLT